MSEESFKGWFHAGFGVFAGVMVGYNLMRFCAAKKPRNAANIAIYGSLLLYELEQAKQHWSQP